MSHVAQQPVHQLHMTAAEGRQQSCLAAVVTRLEGGGGANTQVGVASYTAQCTEYNGWGLPV